MDFRNGYAVFEGRQRSLTEFTHFRIQRYGFLSIFFKIFCSFFILRRSRHLERYQHCAMMMEYGAHKKQ